MNRLFYIAMSGAKEIMHAQTVNTHNLANANTTGFRRDLESFTSMPVTGPGYQSRAYAVADRMDIDFEPGALLSTGRDLDVAIHGDGWIAVQAPDGNEGYTRAGDLKVDNNGLLTTGTGLPVLGNGGPIAIPPFEKLDIAGDGTITVQPLGQAANALAVVDRIKLVNPPAGGLEKGKDGLIRTRTGNPAVPDAGVQLAVGSLESSNVNSVEAMVNMIQLARKFEFHTKVMKTAEENDQTTAHLMRLS
jgi:flagellar basal-body rod protein FlgF